MGKRPIEGKPEYRRERENSNQKEEERQRYESVIAAINGIRAPINGVSNTQEARYKQTDTHERRRRNREIGTIIALLLAAVVAACGILQSHSDTRRVLKDARLAADQQHRDTLDSFEAVQRAFIVTELTRVRIGTAPSTVWNYSIVISNSGNTPTQNLSFVSIDPPDDIHILMDEDQSRLMRAFCLEHAVNAPRDPDRLFADSVGQYVRDTSPIGHLLLGPKQIAGIGDFSLMQEEITQEWLWHSPPHFFAGEIKYHDIFPNSPEHISKFCYNIGAGIRGNTEPLPGRCAHWNCADAECEADHKRYEKEIEAVNDLVKYGGRALRG
ncbi:MAG: hypothetical protein ACHQC9_07435 [Alphaproteobacteria bacterium]